MDINPLEIKLIRQEPHSNDCLRACALMVFKYFNESENKPEVWKKLHVYKKHSGLHGGYLSDLGSLAISKGYFAEISHYASHWWNKETLNTAKEDGNTLIKALKEIKKRKSWAGKKLISKEINYIKKGGLYKIGFPKLESINDYLLQRVPVIITVRAENLYQDPKEKYSHAIVVTGKKGDNYFIKDPYLGIEVISKDELYYSWIRNGGWTIVIYPKEKSENPPTTKQPELKF